MFQKSLNNTKLDVDKAAKILAKEIEAKKRNLFLATGVIKMEVNLKGKSWRCLKCGESSFPWMSKVHHFRLNT
jgi:hypothetical protein